MKKPLRYFIVVTLAAIFVLARLRVCGASPVESRGVWQLSVRIKALSAKIEDAQFYLRWYGRAIEITADAGEWKLVLANQDAFAKWLKKLTRLERQYLRVWQRYERAKATL